MSAHDVHCDREGYKKRKAEKNQPKKPVKKVKENGKGNKKESGKKEK
jgi:hypothetical protein